MSQTRWWEGIKVQGEDVDVVYDDNVVFIILAQAGVSCEFLLERLNKFRDSNGLTGLVAVRSARVLRAISGWTVFVYSVQVQQKIESHSDTIQTEFTAVVDGVQSNEPPEEGKGNLQVDVLKSVESRLAPSGFISIVTVIPSSSEGGYELKSKLVKEYGFTIIGNKGGRNFINLLDRENDSFNQEIDRLQRAQAAKDRGYIDFMGREFRIDPAVFSPRSSSSILVENAVRLLQHLSKSASMSVLDLGTGSGCLLLSILTDPSLRHLSLSGVGVDVSNDALRIAQENATLIGVVHNCNFVHCDFLVDKIPTSNQPFDIVVCNPPYLDPDRLPTDFESYGDPKAAVLAGKHGMDVYEKLRNRVAMWTTDMITENAYLLLEVPVGGQNIASAVESLFNQNDVHGRSSKFVSRGFRLDKIGGKRCLVLQREAGLDTNS